MKNLLFIIATSISIHGLGQCEEFTELIIIDGRYCLDSVPYTGCVIDSFRTGAIWSRGQLKNGVKTGKWTYYENDDGFYIRSEEIYYDDKMFEVCYEKNGKEWRTGLYRVDTLEPKFDEIFGRRDHDSYRMGFYKDSLYVFRTDNWDYTVFYSKNNVDSLDFLGIHFRGKGMPGYNLYINRKTKKIKCKKMK